MITILLKILSLDGSSNIKKNCLSTNTVKSTARVPFNISKFMQFSYRNNLKGTVINELQSYLFSVGSKQLKLDVHCQEPG